MYIRSMQFFKYYLCATGLVVFLFLYLPSGIVVMISDSGTLRSILICVSVSWLINSFCSLWVFSVTHHEAGSPNTIGLFSSTNAECFPTPPSRPILSCVELAQGVRALAPRLLQRSVSHLPTGFLVRSVLLIKVGHSSCQQWVNTVVSETLRSFLCCLQCAYPAAAGKACRWWCSFRQLPRNLSASKRLQYNAGGAS